jgi:hypothetical protein
MPSKKTKKEEKKPTAQERIKDWRDRMIKNMQMKAGRIKKK